MNKNNIVIFDFPCSLTFREFEAELSSFIFQKDKPTSTISPINDVDLKEPKIIAFLSDVVSFPKKLKGVPL